MTTRPATTAEIRRAFKADGHHVRISRDGRVTFKRGGVGPWLDGRWAAEYVAVKLDDGRVTVALR